MRMCRQGRCHTARTTSGRGREVRGLAQGCDAAPGRGALLREARERPQRRVAARRAEDAAGEVERDLVTVADEPVRLDGLERGDPQVHAVAEEDAREAHRDDAADTELLQRERRVLPRGPATEVLAADEDVAGPDLLREARTGIAERELVELVAAHHEGRVAA